MAKSYTVSYFRLSDEDYKAVGCTKAEMEEIDKLNKELDVLLKKEEELGKEKAEDGSKKELSEAEKAQKRTLHEKLYMKFIVAADRNPKAWEYKPSILPAWAQSTGSIEVQDTLLWVYGKQLPLADKVRALKRRMVTMQAKQLAKEDRENPRQNPYTVEENENGVFLKGVNQKEFQSSKNGCWSASTALLIQSRGIDNVTQTDVRAFRPNYTGDEIRVKLLDEAPSEKEKENGITAHRMGYDNKEAYTLMQTDTGNNLLDRGDAFLNLAPNSMLQGITIMGYNEDARRAGLTREQYLANAEKVVREHIIHALKDEKSPVSFLAGGHYITITGIDKNGNVEYRDSSNREDGKGPNEPRKTKLSSLLLRLTKRRPSAVTMNWASDINLSQDGKTLYGVPTEYLNVAEDGSLIRPTALKDEANLIDTYQKKTGTFVERQCVSENPDAQTARDEYLRNGGVNLKQVAYLPEKLDMEALKKKAELRSPEEEKRLQNVSEEFYKIKYNPNAPAETPESMNEKYNAKVKDFNLRPKDFVLSVVESARVASEKNNVAPIGGVYAEYIDNNLMKNVDFDKLKEYQKKELLCKGLAAAKLEAEGTKADAVADVNKINQLAAKFKASLPIDHMELPEVMTILNQPNKVAAFTGAYKDIELGDFKVEPKHYDGYFRELKTLQENMMSKEKRTPEYQRYYDAIDNASKLDRNDPNLDEKIAKANKEILESVEVYTKGKKSVRHSSDGQARFDNALDGLSIVGIYAPRGCKARAEKLFARVNEVRGIDKNSSNRLIINDFGAENAAQAAAKRGLIQSGPKK